MRNGRMHLIGHAHIDPVWLWQWPEGLQEVKATFRSALDRLSENDDFLFVSSSAAFYKWIEDNEPTMFREIQKRVAEGRWELVGGWWVEPDCNIPCGESFIRQALQGQSYFRSRFGREACVGFNPDSFGHNAMLPQILQKSGVDYYVFMRPGPHEKELPGHVFWWQAPDGSRVLAFQISFSYNSWRHDIEDHVRRTAGELTDAVPELMCFFGVGNHGGGPTQENLLSIRHHQKDPSLPELVFSTPQRYFEAIADLRLDLPLVADDLQHHAPGCYAAHSGIKEWNRRAEAALLQAERWAAAAETLLGQAYHKGMDQAWQNVLFNQFHDILAGTSLQEAYDDARHMYGEAVSIAHRNLQYAVQSISWNIAIPEAPDTKPIVVFNPHSWDTVLPVELEIADGTGAAAGHWMLVREDDGSTVPVQLIQAHATTNRRARISFQADLPALGFGVWRLCPQEAQTEQPGMAVGETVMENSKLRIEVDPHTGSLQHLLHKASQLDVLAGQGMRPVVIDDLSDTWSHDVPRFDQEVGTFSLRSVRWLEDGPVQSVLRVESTYGRSVLVSDYVLYADAEFLDVRVSVDWREQFKMLKLRTSLQVADPQAVAEIPFGSIVRSANGDEEPGQSWVDVSGRHVLAGTACGLTVANSGRYSYDVNGSDMGLTVLRSPIYAHHDPKTPDPEAAYTFIDQGLQEVTYRLVPHVGAISKSQAFRRAAELNQPGTALIETFHDGDLPVRSSFLQVSSVAVIVTAVKKAADNDDIIVRGFETEGRAVTVEFSLPHCDRAWTAEFAPHTIKTFRVPAGRGQPIREVSAIEQPMGDGTAAEHYGRGCCQ